MAALPHNLQTTPAFTASDFAVLLGLRESAAPGAQIPEGNEYARTSRMDLYLRRNRQDSGEQQSVIWAKFCAQYLPATVERCINLPFPADWDPNAVEDFLLDNAWMNMLVAVQHTPYFNRYFRSSSPVADPGKRFPQVLAERFLTLAPRLEHEISRSSPGHPGRQERSKFVAAKSLLILGTLLRLSRLEPRVLLPRQLVARLSSFLRRWKTRHHGVFLGAISGRLHFFITARIPRPSPAPDPPSEPPVKPMRKPCSLPSCPVRDNLQTCGRCRTVRYCCIDHQRAHWEHPGGEHKLKCHETLY